MGWIVISPGARPEPKTSPRDYPHTSQKVNTAEWLIHKPRTD